MFSNSGINANTSLIIVCDDKEISLANYLIQLIGQNDDKEQNIVGVKDNTVSAAIFTVKYYKDNLPTISSNTHILFIGESSVAKEQRKTIQDKFSKLGMHYGWLGKRAVLYVDDSSAEWIKLKDDKKSYNDFISLSNSYGLELEDVLAEYAENINKGILVKTFVTGMPKTFLEYKKAKEKIKEQQYRLLEFIFYNDDLKNFIEG